MLRNESKPPAGQGPRLQLEPHDVVVFKDKLGHIGSIQLVVKNKEMSDVYFKIKCTASKFYSVRPTAGLVKPHSQVKVVILPNDDSLAQLDVIEAQKHKFKIQAAFVAEPSISPELFWKHTDQHLKMGGGGVVVSTLKLDTKVDRVQPASAAATSHNGRQALPQQSAAFGAALMAAATDLGPSKEQADAEHHPPPAEKEKELDRVQPTSAATLHNGRQVLPQQSAAFGAALMATATDLGPSKEQSDADHPPPPAEKENEKESNNSAKKPTVEEVTISDVEKPIVEKDNNLLQEAYANMAQQLVNFYNSPSVTSSPAPVVTSPVPQFAPGFQLVPRPQPSAFGLSRASNNTTAFADSFRTCAAADQSDMTANYLFSQYIAEALFSELGKCSSKDAAQMRVEMSGVIAKYAAKNADNNENGA